MSEVEAHKLRRHYRRLVEAIQRSLQVVLDKGDPRSDSPDLEALSDEYIPGEEPDDPTIVRHYRRLVEAIQQATEIVLYKGCSSLDHPHPEEPVIRFDDYRFYQDPLPLKSEAAAKLTALCCNPENFNLDGLIWMCAFHEDYGVEWRSGDQATRLVFCFTCHVVYGRHRGGEFFMTMASPEVFQELLPTSPRTDDE
jgi:hypothetical protein